MAINLDPILSEVNSLCSADKVGISEAIFQRYIADETFTAHHEVMTDIRNGRVIPILDARPDYGYMKVRQGNCQMNICEITTDSSAKKWNPVDYNCRLVICKDDLDCDFKKFWDMNCKDYSSMDDAFMDFIAAQALKNLNSSQWRIAYFDDSADTDPLYAGIDGLFKQYLAIAPEGSAQHIDIPENDGATIEDQLNLAPDRAYQIFRAMYAWASINNPSLLTSPDAHIDVTPALAFNYLQYLQDNKEVNCCFSTTDGVSDSRYSIDRLFYLGIPIHIRNEWDGVIKWQQTQSGAVNLDNPHRALLTTKSNKPIGTCDDESFSNFDMFYDRKDKQIYVDVETSFDAKVVVDTDFVIAI